MTDDRLAFEAAIAESPDDLALRLVYADWLDERDGEVRCESCRGRGYHLGWQGGRIPCLNCRGHKGYVPNGFRSLAADQRLFVQMQAVIANPESDAPRLEWARIAEAYGRMGRAEFVRVQIEMARMKPVKIGCSFLADGSSVDAEHRAVSDENPREEKLRRRELELLKKNYHSWFNLSGPWLPHGQAPAGYRSQEPTVFLSSPDNEHQCEVKIRRGFIDTVSCTLADFLDNGREICRNHPVTEVRISDRVPLTNRFSSDPHRLFNWFVSADDATHCIPPTIAAFMGWERFAYDNWLRFETREAAMLALSRAFIAWARSRPTAAPPSSPFGKLSRPPELSPPVLRD